MNMLNVWVNRAITQPNVIDGVYTDPKFADRDSTQGYETVKAFVVSKEFIAEVQTRLKNVAEGLDKLEASTNERTKVIARLETTLQQVEAERQQMRDLLHRCVNHLSETTQPDLELERSIRVALGLSTDDVDATIDLFGKND